MRTKHRFMWLFCLIPCILGFNALAAQSGSTGNTDRDSKKITLITINHKTDSISCCTVLEKDLKPDSDNKMKKIDWNNVVISTSEFRIRIVDTHTALYRYQISSSDIPSPEADTLKSFFTGLGPYLADWPATALSRAKDLQPASIKSDSTALTMLDAAIYGPRGLRNTMITIVDLLYRTKIDSSELQTEVKEAIDERFVGGLKDPYRFAFRDTICLALKILTENHDSLIQVIEKSSGNIKENMKKLHDQAVQALDDSEKIFSLIAVVEELAKSVSNARDTWTDIHQYAITLREGKKINVKISPKSSSLLRPLAELDEKEYQITVSKDWPVHLGVGLSLLVSPRSTFPVYGIKSQNDSLFVTQTATFNNQADYALSLGLQFKRLGPVTLWLPELSINPSNKMRSFGIGGGLSLGVIKVCAGFLWTKHAVLDSLRLGEYIPPGDDLKTKEIYDHGRYFIGISLIGWPPFKP